MSIFQDILSNPNGVENKYLGPTYPYHKNIKTPEQIGMSDKGTIKALTNDIDGLIKYVEVLVTGKSKASVTGGPLGNKFFLKTGAKCIDTKTKNQVDRYIYINNIPDGSVPFVSSGMGGNFKRFKGLIPGVIGNMNVLNPYNILSAFTSGSNPECQEITLQTVDVNNNVSSESHYVTLVDIETMNPCNFNNKKNPKTGVKCKEAFQNNDQGDKGLVFPDDIYVQLYFAGLCTMVVYILYKLSLKNHIKR
jgi:hypothetical protein